MYWANSRNGQLFQDGTSIHTYIMEAFMQAGAPAEEMDRMKLWLLKQKQTQLWESTPASVNSIAVLLGTGSDWLQSEGSAELQLGHAYSINTQQADAGTGYVKESLLGNMIIPDMGKVLLSKTDAGPAWGAVYWQYFEEMDKVVAAQTGLQVRKSLFIEQNTPKSPMLVPVSPQTPIRVGDKVIVRLTVRTDRDLEYVMLKDHRAACFEPVDQLSGIQWRNTLLYYQSNKDVSSNFYFYRMPRGTYVFEYAIYAARAGEYSNGMANIQCMYAPEFTSQSAGSRITVE